MKNIVGLILAFAHCLVAGVDSNSLDEAYLLRGWSFSVAGGKPQRYWFFTTPEQVAKDRGWIAGVNAFPLSLSRGVNDAKQSLLKEFNITNRIELQEICINQLVLPTTDPTVMNSTVGLSNRWVVSYQFLAQEEYAARSWHMMSLLDGTMARLITDASARRLPSTMRTICPDVTAGIDIGRVNWRSNAVAKLASKEINLPARQWNPQSDSFPIDIGQYVQRARTRVQTFAKNGALALVQVKVEPLSYDAIRSKGLMFSDNKYQWWIVYTFREMGENGPNYEVFILHDGTLL